jgi:hypothetical protein
MSLILLEALGALVLLVFIVWWTMFSGRKGGELPQPEATVPREGVPGASPAVEPGAVPQPATADARSAGPER